MNNFKNYLLAQPRHLKKLIFLAHDVIVFCVAFWLSMNFRFDFSVQIYNYQNWLILSITILFSILFFIRLNLYKSVLRYMGSKVFGIALVGSIVSSLLLVTTAYFFHTDISRIVPILYFFFLFFILLGSRILISTWLQGKWHRTGLPVIIYGAGNAGRQLQEALKQLKEYYPVAFIDDDESLQRTVIQNVTVFSSTDLRRIIDRHKVQKILLAIPSASIEQRKAIIHRLESLPCEVLSIPSMKDFVDGKIKADSLKKISVLDLLGRTPVEPVQDLLLANIYGKVVMVTGAGGSIGSELCRQIINNKPSKLILFELSEYGLYSIEKELRESILEKRLSVELIPLLGSVQHFNRLFVAMQYFKVQTVYHAAAYKHVPIVEYNTVEGVRNNIFGTLYSAQAAIKANVETFVLISTDKAVRPTNVMGATKRMAELVLQALSRVEGQQVRFCMVRFGNVLGSSGSVVPVFEKQIATGGPISLTHPGITRYFMTIPEAAQLVIQAGAMGHGGDVFVLDMGESVKIIDLAKQMIRLSGLRIKDEQNPDGDIEIKIIGLRPGEKLYEELLIGENVSGTLHPRIMTASEKCLDWSDFNEILKNLDIACEKRQYKEIRRILQTAPIDYMPVDDIVDLVWLAEKNTYSS